MRIERAPSVERRSSIAIVDAIDLIEGIGLDRVGHGPSRRPAQKNDQVGPKEFQFGDEMMRAPTHMVGVARDWRSSCVIGTHLTMFACAMLVYNRGS